MDSWLRGFASSRALPPPCPSSRDEESPRSSPMARFRPSKIQTFRNPDFQYIGLGRPFGIPFQAFIVIAVVALSAWVVRSTTLGRYLLAIGGNEAAARLAGVPVSKVKITVYVVSGLLAGLAG